MNQRVVMIDDDQDDVYLLEHALKAHSPTIQVSWYESATAFLEAYPFVPKPRLILLDHGLPGQSGLDWLQTLLAHPCCADVPVVLLTGNESSQHQQVARQAGAAGYLIKPTSSQQMHQLVDHIVRSWLAC